MRSLHTTIPGVLAFEPEPHRDERGFFVRVFDADLFAAAGVAPLPFVQENQSRSARPTLRGLHVRRTPTEAKTVRCARGSILAVVVDLRPWSAAFTGWESFSLDDDVHRQLFVPPGCALGFQVVSDHADVCYRHTRMYEPGLDVAVAWNDPELAIPWPLPDPVLSERDRAAPRLSAVRAELSQWFADVDPDQAKDGSGSGIRKRPPRAR